MNYLEALKTACDASNMSERSKENYTHPLEMFLTWLNGREITPEAITEYHAKLKRIGYETATMKLHACAIRFFLRNVLKREDFVSQMPSIKQVSKLPVVLSKEEVKYMIGSALNNTHKTILTVLYSCGLRLSELLSIKMREIDYYRKNIVIHGKGRRDRFVPINDKIIEMIKKNMGDLKPNDFFVYHNSPWSA
jgi:integrase/recombinase XerD